MSDIDTGEDLGIMAISELKDLQRKRDYSINKQENDKFNIELAKRYGKFYFLFFKLSTSNIEKQHVIRFLYLCIFMDYENKLVYGNAKKENRYMREEDLPEVLMLGKASINKTKESLLKHRLMFIDAEGHILINHEYCLKGKVLNDQKESMKIRMFEDAIRELYKKALPREHKKLSLFVALLPFINFYHNVLCKNPDCDFEYQIKPLNMKDICEVVKYSENHIAKLRKDLLDLRIGGELVVMLAITGEAEMIIINPRVYYRANLLKILDPISNKFLIKS